MGWVNNRLLFCGSVSLFCVRWRDVRHWRESLDAGIGSASMIADIGELRGTYAPFDAAIIGTVTCRRKARTRFPSCRGTCC